MPEQMFIEVEMEHEVLPEVKEEIEDEVVQDEKIHEPGEIRRSPIKHGADWASMVPETMRPNVLLSKNLGKLEKISKVDRDKKRCEKIRLKLLKVRNELNQAKMKNEFLQKDLVMTKNRINFIEANFGGAASKRNNPYLLHENES